MENCITNRGFHSFYGMEAVFCVKTAGKKLHAEETKEDVNAYAAAAHGDSYHGG
jgi:hypothetical protein